MAGWGSPSGVTGVSMAGQTPPEMSVITSPRAIVCWEEVQRAILARFRQAGSGPPGAVGVIPAGEPLRPLRALRTSG